VVAITDGDTLKVLQDGRQIKVRLANIDAPEKSQAWGQRSKQSLSEICFGKDAQLDVKDIDRYGRTVAVVMCAGVQANRAQVDRGMAWVYVRYNLDRTLPVAQEQAKADKRGLWSSSAPTPPWKWRKSRTRK
jgi:micrococcal nuclease